MAIRTWLATAALILMMGNMAARAGEVVLFSSNPPEILDLVTEGFERETGIRVKVVYLGSGEAMNRIVSKRGKEKADLFWSGNIAMLEAARSSFMPYRSPEAANLPAGYVGRDHRWTACTVQLMVLMVNTDLTDGVLPAGWSDILKPEWKGKLAMADPRKSGSAYSQLYGMWKLYGDDVMEKLIANATILDNSAQVHESVAAGEFAVGLTMEYAVTGHIADGADNIRIVYPADGVIAGIEGMGIVSYAANPDEARKLFDYLLSDPVESMLFERFHRRPADPNAVPPPGLPALSDLNLLQEPDLAEYARLEKDLLYRWRALTLKGQ